MSQPQSKRELALDLCYKLLNDLDAERISASAALQRLRRIGQLTGDSDVAERAKCELDGFTVVGESPEDMRRQLTAYRRGKEKFSAEQIEDIVKEHWKIVPTYRQPSFRRDSGVGFKRLYLTESISKYEELLDRIRKDTKSRYTFSAENETVVSSAAELNKLVAGAQRWVYEQVSSIQERLEFGQIPLNALETTFQFVDTQLFELIPEAAERLLVAYRNLAERSEENWVNVVDTVRRVIKDFADAVFPPSDQPIDGLVVTDDKYLNRIRAYIKSNVESRRQRDQLDTVLGLLGELLARTDNLASRSVHAGKVSRYEAERIVLYTYLAIGDVLVLSGKADRHDAVSTRPNLNSTSLDELREVLGLSSSVAAEILKARKRRGFQSWTEVAAIKGIGAQTLKRLKEVASL